MDDSNDFEIKENNPIKLRPQFQSDLDNEDEETPKMARWLINHSVGIIKNGKQANYVLVGITAISFAIAAWMIFQTL